MPRAQHDPACFPVSPASSIGFHAMSGTLHHDVILHGHPAGSGTPLACDANSTDVHVINSIPPRRPSSGGINGHAQSGSAHHH
jgi:hypothetical protein